MKNNWKWIVGITAGLLVLFALPFLVRNFGYYGMMGGGRHSMMGGYGFSPFGGLFMGFGMLLVWLFPLGLLFLIIYGAVRLANKPNTPAPLHTCPNCGQSTQNDWKNCPYCGKEL